MFDWLRSMFQPKPAIAGLYEQFVAAFLEECKRQGRKPASYDHQTRSFVFSCDPKEGELRVFLENNFRVWHQRDAKARADQLTRFVRSIGEIERHTGIDPATLPAELMPGIRSRALISDVLIQNWMRGAVDGNSTEYAWTPLCGELAACIVRDLPDSMAPLTWSNLDSAKLSFEQAMAHAMTQFRVKAPPLEFLPAPRADGLFYSCNLEDYQSSLLLMIPGKDFGFPPLDGDAVALIPTRNQFFVTGHRNQPALRELLLLAENAGQQTPFCSSALLRWHDGRWNEFLFEAGTDEAMKQRQITLRQLASDYKQQKELLDQLHNTRKVDIYVSELTVYRSNDQRGSEFSVTTLASGTSGTLLPEADRLAFGDQIIGSKTGLAQGVRETVIVPWPIAMEIAGHLFDRVPNLYPPRHRALGFPRGSMWDKLREHAGP